MTIFFCHYYSQGGGGLVHQLRKSYSLTDLGHDENDYGATITEQRAITSEPGMNHNYRLLDNCM